MNPVINVIDEYELNALPARFGSASLAAAGAGIAMAWQGSVDGAPDSIWYATFSARKGWQEPRQVATAPEGKQCWDPAVHATATGGQYIFYAVGAAGEGRPAGGLQGMVISGKRPGEPRPLPEGVLGPQRSGQGVKRRHDVLFATHDQPIRIDAVTPTYRKWDRVATIEGARFDPIEPALCSCGDGFLLLCRSGCGNLVEIWSHDQGETWDPPRRSRLPNPGSKVEAITLKDERILLVYNHSTEGRRPLNVALYQHESWIQGPVLAQGEGEFSFPAAAQSADGLVHVVFADGSRDRARHLVMQLS